MKTLSLLIPATALIMASALVLSSCKQYNKVPSEAEDAAEQVSRKAQVLGRPVAVQYTVAENYFIKNGAKIPDSHKITNKEDFDSIFGMATTMGENGKPTEIDFDKNFVIAVETGPVQKETKLIPEYLINHHDGKLVFHYAIKQGKDITYTIRPVLIIIVDKSQEYLTVRTVAN